MQNKSTLRQNEILNAALQCFTNNGIEATSIEDICTLANASVGSIYHHFGNKQNIATALYKKGIKQHQTHLLNSIQNATSMQAFISQLIGSTIDWITLNPDLTRFMFKERHASVSEADENALRDERKAMFAELHTRCKTFPDFKNVYPLAPSIYLSILLGPVYQYAREWLGGRAPQPLSEFKSDFIDAALRALLMKEM